MSRTLSFTGSNFDVVDYELPPHAAAKYDAIVDFWLALQSALEVSAEKMQDRRALTGDELKRVKSMKRILWGAQQVGRQSQNTSRPFFSKWLASKIWI